MNTCFRDYRFVQEFMTSLLFLLTFPCKFDLINTHNRRYIHVFLNKFVLSDKNIFVCYYVL